MTDALLSWAAARSGATSARRGQRLQSLWSGYGEIVRVHLDGADRATAIVKRVDPPGRSEHPRGWSSDRSHQRKLRSYAVEEAFYGEYAARSRARVPACSAVARRGEALWFLLEDLDAAGFSERRRDVDDQELARCLRWLADFHAGFMGVRPAGLWPTGTYWHLETRPDELAAMAPGPLRDAARDLDAALEAATHQTLVHGDAKLANYCFSPAEVAAVDFQYVGRGCGMRDVAYLLSCLAAERCAAHEARYLGLYFERLRAGLAPDVDGDAVEAEWRALYPVAWADFERFLAGWAPHHPKRSDYAARLTRQALDGL